jgi:hypothetical protein
VLRADAARYQDLWRCPLRPGGEAPTLEDPTLPTAALDALGAVGALTGAVHLRTCPGWYARLPWVHRVVQARTWRDHGQLHLLERCPSSALVAAIDAVDLAVSDRQTDDLARIRARSAPDSAPDPEHPHG